MYTLKLPLSLWHPGPFQLITVNSNVLITYYSDTSFSLYDRKNGLLEFITFLTFNTIEQMGYVNYVT